MIKKLIGIISRKGTARNFMTLVSGTTLAQVFSLIFYPILARMFSAENFGLLSLLSSISAIITVIASGKYEQAIIITRNRSEAINVASLSLICSIIVCGVIFVIMLFFSEMILVTADNETLKGWIYLSPLIAFFIIIYNTFNEWCVKKSSFSALAINKITNAGSISLSKFGFGLARVGGGLVWGEVLGRGLSALSCLFHWLRVDKADFKLVTWKKIRAMSKKYVDFPKYTMPDQIINTFTGNLSILFIVTYFGEANLGYYAMTQNVLAIPMTFVGQAVMDVFRNRANQDFERTGCCQEIYNKLLRKLIPAIIAILASVILFLPSIFVFVLGEKWRVAGELSQILAPAIAVGFLGNAFMSVWIIAGKLKQRFMWQVFYFCMILSSMLIGCIFFNDMKKAIYCLSIGLSVSYGTSIFFTWRYSRGK